MSDLNLKLYMPLDRNSRDYSGSRNHGTPTGVTWDAAPHGGAPVFNGTTGRIVTARAINQTLYTFCFSLYPTAVSGGAYHNRILGPTDTHWLMQQQGRGVGFYGSTLYAPLSTYVLNKWTHYVIPYNRSSGAGTIYVNGLWVASGTCTHAAPTGLWVIGHSENTGVTVDSYIGRISGLKIYERLLTGIEAMQEYNQLVRNKSNV